MPRNLERRVEVIAPVQDARLTVRLDEILRTGWEDDTLAWELGPDGSWAKVPTERGINAQERSMQLALERASGAR